MGARSGFLLAGRVEPLGGVPLGVLLGLGRGVVAGALAAAWPTPPAAAGTALPALAALTAILGERRSGRDGQGRDQGGQNQGMTHGWALQDPPGCGGGCIIPRLNTGCRRRPQRG